jgi:UDP-N-acetylmuramate-alanine ligase
MPDDAGDTPFRYHLELTPQQLKLTHTALRSLLDDFGHDNSAIHKVIREILDKLPDEHAIRAIQLDHELSAAEEILSEPPSSSGDDEPPPAVA